MMCLWHFWITNLLGELKKMGEKDKNLIEKIAKKMLKVDFQCLGFEPSFFYCKT